MNNKIHDIIHDKYPAGDLYWVLVAERVGILAYQNDLIRVVGAPIMFIDDEVVSESYKMVEKLK